MSAITLKGVAQALLMNVGAIAANNDPQTKISPVGFLRALLENNAMTEINNLAELQAGQNVPVKLRYMQRGLESEVSTTDSCDASVTPSWQEATITRPLYSQIGIFISEATMRQYELEATQTMQITANGANPAAITTPLMRGLYEVLLTKIQSIVSHMDTQLVTAQASAFGVNVKNAAGNHKGALAINLGEHVGMNDGYVKLITDMQANEVADDIFVVGNGLVNAFDVYNRFKTGTDAEGIGALGLKTYNDPKTASAWGANHFGAFAKGTIGLVDWCKNKGVYAGERGGSVFFTFPVPVTLANGELSTLEFDCQLKYVDCPIYNDSNEKIADRGYKLIVSKSYGLFNLPSTAFASTDALNGVNGSFRYVASYDQGVKVKPVEVYPSANAVFTTQEAATEEAEGAGE